MKELLQIIAVAALLNLTACRASADGPTVSAQPDLQPGTDSSIAGGSASASPGAVGPANVSSSEPIGATSSNTAAPNSSSGGSMSASGPGTQATVPTRASATKRDPSAPDGSAPAPTTSGPTANADASHSDVSTSDSRVRANLRAIATGSFAGSAAGIGSAEDPTRASTCSTAEASPGVPTDASLGTTCGSGASSVSEDYAASDTNGNGGAGTPSASSCVGASASAGPSPSGGISGACPAQAGSGAGAPSVGGTGNASVSGPGSPVLRAAPQAQPGLFGLAALPSTATGSASAGLLGMILGGAGLMLLRRRPAQPFAT